MAPILILAFTTKWYGIESYLGLSMKVLKTSILVL